ncbi:MAG: nucleotide sugar dehydrogenase [Candidatus Bathyarchaeia archaeon]|nr:nucleotide sugar dehydrogenase [Candidatus Bathyarchaeota archaeon]
MKNSSIVEQIKRGELPIAIVGLGWMGLPTACLYAEAGAKVFGIDKNIKVVNSINEGISPIPEPGLQKLLERNVKLGRLKATENFSEAIPKSRFILIIVPTKVNLERKPDYSALTQSCTEVGKNLSKDSCVIIESTCGPTVTEKLLKPILEKFSGLKAGEDFALAYSPIRAKSGTAIKDLQSYPRIVGGINEESLNLACAVKSVIVKNKILKARDLKTAEAIKLFEVIYRDVNIALANELAVLCEKIGIDYIEAMTLANTQPYSNLHIPSVGVGGHCLPVYPYLLNEEASKFGVKLKLIKTSREINEFMPKHVLKLTAEALRVCKKPFQRAKIAVLGISYRANVKEVRGSPALELINIAKRRGAEVTVFDPKYSLTELKNMGLNSKPSLQMVLDKKDCAIITVAHDEFKQLKPEEFRALMNYPAAVIDCAHIVNPEEVEKVGLVYRGVGRGLWKK